jgi:8-oxo-dGTP pyrophosphatase MutT (NUDIX family)
VIIFEAGGARFNFRVAGACRHGRHVLLHQAEGDDAWLLPGGHTEAGEPAREALAREWREELGLEVSVGRLLWVVENFFPYAGGHRHEIGFYFDVSLPEGADELDQLREFRRHPVDVPYALRFRWFPADELFSVPLYPAFLRTALAEPPAGPVHVVHTGDRWELPPA